jgi:hypothetical protein
MADVPCSVRFLRLFRLIRPLAGPILQVAPAEYGEPLFCACFFI